jgi:hypothetical protein
MNGSITQKERIISLDIICVICFKFFKMWPLGKVWRKL